MLNNDLADELRDEQNAICDIIGDYKFEKWHKNDELKKLILYKAIKNLFERELPNFKANKGFVLCGNELTPCIDMIIYEGNTLNHRRNDDFIIIKAEQVKAIIKLVGTFQMIKCKFQHYIDELCELKESINADIFTGICAYHFEKELNKDDFKTLFATMKKKFEPQMQEKFANTHHFINSISLGKDWLMRFWHKDEKYHYPCYETYNAVDYAFDYLILNFREHFNLATNVDYKNDGLPRGKDSVKQGQIILEQNRVIRNME